MRRKKLITLIGLWSSVPDRLTADLMRFYGISLDDVLAKRVSVRTVAHCVAHMPRGGAVAQWYGGWEAFTVMEEAQQGIMHLLNVQIAQTAGKRKPPKPPEAPKGLREIEQENRRKARAAAEKRRALERMSKMYGA